MYNRNEDKVVMDRTRTLFKYVLWVIIVYMVSNLMIWALLRVSYKEIKDYSIDVKSAKITILETKSTSRNCYIKGKINNISDLNVKNKYIKIDLFSKRDVLLSTKYIKIENMEPYDIYEFQIDFQIGNVEKFKISQTETINIDDTKITDLIINSIPKTVNEIINIPPVDNKLSYPTK